MLQRQGRLRARIFEFNDIGVVPDVYQPSVRGPSSLKLHSVVGNTALKEFSSTSNAERVAGAIAQPGLSPDIATAYEKGGLCHGSPSRERSSERNRR